ncbi:MAG: sulfatase [bacterium]|nr:sulfatase [bacterium]
MAESNTGARPWHAVALGLAAAAAEALLWIADGRVVPVWGVLALGLALGVAGAIVGALGMPLARVPWAPRLAIVIGFASAVAPQVGNLVRRLDLAPFADGLATSVAAIGIGACVAALLAFRPVRVALVGGAGLAAGIALATLATRAERPPLAPPGAHPDVVFIVMDTTRRDRLSLYGHDRATTPAIDRLASRARVYDDAWSAAPWTPPSHATLFTGLLPAEHGVDGVHVPAFPAELPSLPDRLQAAGYRTAGWVANPNLLGPGWERGFDVYAPPWFAGPHSLTALLNRGLMGGKPAWLDDGASDRVLARAKRWWSRTNDAPRFLFMNFVDPHDPYRPLEVDTERVLPDVDRQAAMAVPQDPQRYAVDPGMTDETRDAIAALYDAEIAGLDRRLGVFFDWLEERGELDETLIVITSDHGERLGERGLLGHLLVMDQHLLRVPLLIRHPPSIPPERVAERVSSRDVAGEILEIVGLEPLPPPAGEGLSLSVARVRRGGETPLVAQHGPFGWYLDQLRGRRAGFESPLAIGHWTLTTLGDHVLLWSPDEDEEAAIVVSLEGDPSWERNLAEDAPEIRARLLDAAREAPRYSAEPAVAGEIDEVLRERLRALGYSE